MNYSLTQLTTVAQCDEVLRRLAQERADLELQQRLHDKRRDSLSDGALETDAEMAAKTAELAAVDSLLTTLPDGAVKAQYERKKSALLRRQSQLQDRQIDFNPVVLITREFDVACTTASLTAIDVLEQAVNNHKARL